MASALFFLDLKGKVSNLIEDGDRGAMIRPLLKMRGASIADADSDRPFWPATTAGTSPCLRSTSSPFSLAKPKKRALPCLPAFHTRVSTYVSTYSNLEKRSPLRLPFLVPSVTHTTTTDAYRTLEQYLYIRHSNLYILALTKKNTNATEILLFLHKLVEVFTEYFKVLEEESIRDNFVIIYELLDEMMDFGYPQTTESKILQESAPLILFHKGIMCPSE